MRAGNWELHHNNIKKTLCSALLRRQKVRTSNDKKVSKPHALVMKEEKKERKTLNEL